MKKVTDGRRVHLKVVYNGKNITQDLTGYLTSFQYNDAKPGEQDDISLTLVDKDRKWSKAWTPVVGDIIKVEIRLINWYKEGEKLSLYPGAFEVDTVELSGPPDTVNIKAMAVPITGGPALREKRSKAWEKVRLRTVAQEIATRAKLKLAYEVNDNPLYDRLEQSDQTDLEFLQDTTKKEGISLKVSGSSLVLYDEAKFESQKPVLSFAYGKANIISYSFSVSESNASYASCVVTYTSTKTASKTKKKKSGGAKAAADDKKKDAKTSTTISGKYVIPGAKGPVLKVNEKVESIAEANKLAKNRLREKNKEAGTAKLTVMGDTRLAAGSTITISGFGRFDGKYIIVSASHALTGGAYATDMEIRRVLTY